MIDLRSDTVTRPGKEMLQAMFEAKVGDDVFGEDETINTLEDKLAAIFGKEAAVFCPSGTMTNQIGIKVLSSPPGEVICDELSHVYQYEGGGIAFNSGMSVRLLQGDRGRINKTMVENAINADDVHKPSSQVVSLENTCNRGAGSIYDLKDLVEISSLCRSRKIGIHLDGARIFTALAETDYKATDVGPLFDTISVCLSKGLGCPVGSVLLGTKSLMKQARRMRKVLGGGMRQAGYLAAAGIYALDHNIGRLKEDHARARMLASTLSEMSFVESISPVDTNVVVFKLIDKSDPSTFVETLRKKGILSVKFGPDQIRFVTHLDFSDSDLEETKRILKTI